MVRFMLFTLLSAGLLLMTDGVALALDADQARRAVKRGDARSLGPILQELRPGQPGRMLDADMRRGKNGQLMYRIKLLKPDGQLKILWVDAKTGRVVGEDKR